MYGQKKHTRRPTSHPKGSSAILNAMQNRYLSEKLIFFMIAIKYVIPCGKENITCKAEPALQAEKSAEFYN